MPRDARFWRNVTIIAFAHAVLVMALVGWDQGKGKLDQQSIVWLSSEVAARAEPARETIPPAKADPPPAKPDQPDEPVPASAPSDIHLPNPTPTPTPIPTAHAELTPSPVPKPSVRPTAKPIPPATPQKSRPPKTTPKPSPKKSAPPSEQKKPVPETKEPARIAPADADGLNGQTTGATDAGGAARASEFAWYGKMLHDRFNREWVQPTTSVAAGAKMSALVRIRIEKDGRISKFTIVRPSGNVVVDESVAAIATKVTRVDPLPKGLDGAFHEVNINFELNPQK